MKNKYLLTVKYALASVMLGLFGIIGVSVFNEAPVSASQNALLQIVIDQGGFNFEVINPTDNEPVGNSFYVDVRGSNISTAEVYIDFNGNGSFDDPGELVDATSIDASSSFNTSLGPVTIPDSVSYGTYEMKVVWHQKDGGTEEDFNIIPIRYVDTSPVIKNISPSWGPDGGGTEITITGENFEDGSKVYIGDQECLNTVVVSSTEIRCTTPPSDGSEHVQVTIEGPNGDYTSDYGFLYTSSSESGSGSGGGGGIIGLPNVPNTGLFRVGKTVIMLNDLIVAGLAIVIIALAFVLIYRNKQDKKKSSKAKAKKTTKKAPTKKPATKKRVRSKKPPYRK